MRRRRARSPHSIRWSRRDLPSLSERGCGRGADAQRADGADLALLGLWDRLVACGLRDARLLRPSALDVRRVREVQVRGPRAGPERRLLGVRAAARARHHTATPDELGEDTNA